MNPSQRLVNFTRNIIRFQCRQISINRITPSGSRTILKLSDVSRKIPINHLNKKNLSSSVDNEEMERFKKLSQSFWVQNGEYEALHRMNELRVPLIKETLINNNVISDGSIDKPLNGLNILDVGCGGGILSEPLARLGANVTGIDACNENILSAQLRAETEYHKTNGNAAFYERIRYINCTLEDLADVDDNIEYFDAVVMSEVVEHVNNLEGFLTDSTKLLKNQGFSFVTTINRTQPSYFFGIIAAENILGLVPKGTHTWEKFVKPDEVKDILEKNDVFVKFQTGMCYNPLTQNWSWSNDHSINYAMYAQKQIH